MRRAALALAIAVSIAGRPAAAQWVAEASAGGTDHEAVAATAGSRSAMVALRRSGLRWGYLSAGVPLDSSGLPWVAAGAGTRESRARGAVELGADLSGLAHGYRARSLDATGTGLVLGALPFVAWGAGTTRVELGSGVRSYLSAFDGASSARILSETRATLSSSPAPELGLELRGRYLLSADGGFPFAGALVDLAVGPAFLTAHAGRWIGEELDAAAWGARATLSVGSRSALFAGVEEEAPDPLFWNDRRRSWTLGASHSLGGRISSAPLPPAPVAAAGRVEIRIPASASADPPSVGGDFNEWKPVPMTRQGEWWTVSLPLAPGVYRYAFRRGAGDWFVPASTPGRVDDGFGGESAVLVVGEARDR